MEDRIEICLEPEGHFAIRPGVDDSDSPSTSRPSQNAVNLEEDSSEFITGVRSKLKAGGSGVVTSGGQQVGGYRAFSGHAHTLASGSGQRLGEAPASSSREENSEMPRWSQYQREFNKLLEQHEMQSQTRDHAVEMPEDSQERNWLDDHVQSDTGECPPVTASQGSETITADGVLNKAVDSPIFDLRGAGSSAIDVPNRIDMSPRDDLEMEDSKTHTGGESGEMDIQMDIDKEVLEQKEGHSSPLLPMEVDSTADNIQNAASFQSSITVGGESIGADTTTTPVTTPSPIKESGTTQKSDSSPVYVEKRLGPGYMVLVEQPPVGSSDSEEGASPTERT